MNQITTIGELQYGDIIILADETKAILLYDLSGNLVAMSLLNKTIKPVIKMLSFGRTNNTKLGDIISIQDSDKIMKVYRPNSNKDLYNYTIYKLDNTDHYIKLFDREYCKLKLTKKDIAEKFNISVENLIIID